MQIVDYLIYKFKKKFVKMEITPQIEAQIKRYKQQYFGKTYKWLRAMDGAEMGELVRVTDIKYKEGQYFLVFHSGVPLQIGLIGMYLEEQPGEYEYEPMTSGANQGNTIEIPAELREFQSHVNESALPNQVANPAEALMGVRNVQQQVATRPPVKADIFAMFNTDFKSINMPVSIKMPDIELIKMMFANAADKNSFLNDFAEYVLTSINADAVTVAIKTMLGVVDEHVNDPANDAANDPANDVVNEITEKK